MTPPGNSPTSGSPTPTAEVAKQEGSAVASTVREQASETAQVVQHGGQQVADEAKQQLTQLTEQAQRELHRVIEQAQEELSGRASEHTDKVAAGLHSWAEELRALAEGRINDAPRAVDWLDQTAEQATHYADRLEQRGFAGLVEDVSGFARRRPGAFLLSAIVAGFATGRLARGVQKAGAGDNSAPPAGALNGGPVQGSSSIGRAPAPGMTAATFETAI